MMNKKIYICAALLMVSAAATAQQPLAGEGEYRLDEARLLWHHTTNAAGLSLDSARNHGFAAFDLQHTGGNFYRVQEGGKRNLLTFHTERYQQLGQYLYGYGKFSFDMGRTKNRAWSDVTRSYNSNPYFSGSSIAGRYDHQNIELTAAVGTRDFNGWRFGLRADYKVGDLSRLKDPRSRSQLLDYTLTPGVTYTFGSHTVGLDAYYNRFKEKIGNVTTVQADATLKYYLMSGMENANGSTGGFGGFNREWVNHRFGATLSYGYHNATLNSLNSVSIARGSEGVYGTYKYQPGHYYSYQYAVNSHNLLNSGRLLHQLNVAFKYEQAYADEYRQQLDITTDSATGFKSYHYLTTMTFKKRYQVNLFNLDLHYRLNFTDAQAITGYVGFRGNLQTTRNKYLLHSSSFKYESADFALEGGKGLLGNRLWIDASAGRHNKWKNSLSLANPTTEYAQNVLLADQRYYNANYWLGHLQVMYQVPLTLKGYRSLWYVKAYGDYLHGNNHLNGSLVGISIGLFN